MARRRASAPVAFVVDWPVLHITNDAQALFPRLAPSVVDRTLTLPSRTRPRRMPSLDTDARGPPSRRVNGCARKMSVSCCSLPAGSPTHRGHVVMPAGYAWSSQPFDSGEPCGRTVLDSFVAASGHNLEPGVLDALDRPAVLEEGGDALLCEPARP